MKKIKTELTVKTKNIIEQQDLYKTSKIDLTNFPAGLYFMEFYENGLKIQTAKVVKY